MTKMEKQIRRIEQMEEILDYIQAVERSLDTALERFEKLPGLVKKLDAYYRESWREDYEADEAGLLPPDLKRGLLSEDAVWNEIGRAHV